MADVAPETAPDVDLLRVRAEINANASDREFRQKLITWLLLGLVVVAVLVIALAAFVVSKSTDGTVPDWITVQIATIIAAVIAGATTGWGYMLGSSSGSKSKSEKPPE